MASVNRIGTARGAERDVAHQITNFGVGEAKSTETTANRTTNETPGTNFDGQQMTFPLFVQGSFDVRKIVERHGPSLHALAVDPDAGISLMLPIINTFSTADLFL